MRHAYTEGGEKAKAKDQTTNVQMEKENQVTEPALTIVKEQRTTPKKEKEKDNRKEKEKGPIAHKEIETKRKPVVTVAFLAILQENAGRDNSTRKQNSNLQLVRKERKYETTSFKSKMSLTFNSVRMSHRSIGQNQKGNLCERTALHSLETKKNPI
jgi:hypothetical protein